MKYISTFLVFIGILPAILSQNAWTLEKCITHAMDNSRTIQQSNLGVQLAEIDLKQSKEARNPSINGNTSAYWNFGRTIDPTTNEFITQTFFSNNFGLNTGVLLWNKSRLRNSIKQSKTDLDASKNDIEQIKRNTALLVASNFLNVLFAKENISISEKQLTLNQQQLDQVNKLISAGASPASERLNLEAQIAQSEQGLINSKNNLDIAILNLKQSLVLDPDYELEIEVPSEIATETDPDLISFEEAYALAKKNRPDITATELRMESAEMGVEIAKSALYPSLSMSGSLGTNYSNRGRTFVGLEPRTVSQSVIVNSNDPSLPLTNVPITLSSETVDAVFKDQNYTGQIDENLSYGFGFVLNIPIYNNGFAKANIERAKINAISSQLDRDQLLETLKITVQQSIADARAAKKRLEASNKSVEAQKLAFDNTSKRLKIGAANTFEWEAQKTNLENAEVTALIDKYNYIFTLKTLEFYLGKPLKI